MSFLNPSWPVLKSYRDQQLHRIGLPLGGIGTGTISLGGRGQLFDWEIHNTPAKNAVQANNFGDKTYGALSLFTVYAKAEGGEAFVRALEGILPQPYDGSHGSTHGFHGISRFRDCEFHTAYPLAQVLLDDDDSPVTVRLEAFNPMVPGDADRSGLPLSVFRYVLRNKTDKDLDISVCGSMANLTGGAKKHNRFRNADGLRGLVFTAEDGDPTSRDAGSMVMATTEEDVSCKSIWPPENWRRPLLHFWDDFRADGRLDDTFSTLEDNLALGSLAASKTLKSGDETTITFLLGWHFPNRYNWVPGSIDCDCGGKRLNPADRIGNYYTEQFADAWDVLAKTLPELPGLEADTVRFLDAFCGSDLPEVIKEAALFNASTLRSETCFRTPDGKLYGWEGCCDGSGCCSGSCTHVWNYETTTPYLFADLARTMREVEFLHATSAENGQMSFRVQLPIEREEGKGKAAADGQMGCIMKAYREWKLCGDMDWLRALWPKVRKALEFCWIPGGWDADRDGVMEGCQHNTMDVEYYGPNPQMGTWYLGALRAAEEMANALGETEFAELCHRYFKQGSAWLDTHLFNGEYYEHEIRPPESEAAIAPSLRLNMGAKDLSKPELQLGPGCLVDQLVGQYLAHVCNLGYLLDVENIKTTLQSIMKYNFRENQFGHCNHMRSYVLNDEGAILMASYPRGGRPESPFPYFTEVMTGFEYTAATHMLYEGLETDALKAISAIRHRYDGARRSPFDEAECGHHYARAMAAWTGVLAWTGFHWDGCSKTMQFAARDGKQFWSNGSCWGTCTINGSQADLVVLHGNLEIEHFGLEGLGEQSKAAALGCGDHVVFQV